MNDEVIEPVEPTQVVHPWKAALRTFVQTLVPSLGIFLILMPPMIDIVLDEFTKAGVALPSWLYAALVGASVVCAALASIGSRIMAIPGVNDLFAKIGLGAQPKA